MIFNSFSVIAIIGLVSIIIGNISIYKEKRIRKRYTYPLMILGGILLEIYSIYINDIIFSVLQGIFILSAIYGLIKINKIIKK